MKGKTLLIVLSLVMVAAVSVMGTLAYLTAEDSAVNTFTVGQVGLIVDETAVNAEGEAIEGADRVKENEYHLLPGMSYLKDPTVTVAAESEEAYIRMILTVHNASDVQAMIDKYELGDFSALIGGWNKEVWLYKGFEEDTEANAISFEFRYKETVSTEEDAKVLEPLFTSIIVPPYASGEEMQALYDGGFKMEITGHGIQAAGFEDEDAAWTAFDAQLAFENAENE